MGTAEEPQEEQATRDLGSVRGRSPIRLTAEERRERAAKLRAALDRMEAIPDDPDEDDGAFFRALDESNPGRFDLKRYY